MILYLQQVEAFKGIIIKHISTHCQSDKMKKTLDFR